MMRQQSSQTLLRAPYPAAKSLNVSVYNALSTSSALKM